MNGERLATLVVVCLLLSSAHAGNVKTHEWPAKLASPAFEIAEIPVEMDVGSWASVVGNPTVRLRETSPNTYTGCTRLVIRCNTNVRVTASIVPTGALAGTYSCSISDGNIDAPQGAATLCATLKNPERVPAEPVQVAVIKVSFTPR